MGMTIGLIIIAAACYAYLEIMHKLKKDNTAEKWILGSICVVCVITAGLQLFPRKRPVPKPEDNPEYYYDGDEAYPNPDYRDPKHSIFKPPAHNKELTDAIYSAVKDLGITREEVDVKPTISIDTKVEDLGTNMISVRFSFDSNYKMYDTQDMIDEISQRIIDKYEPTGVNFSFDAENEEYKGLTAILLRNTDDDETYWKLGYMQGGIYKVKNLYKTPSAQ